MTDLPEQTDGVVTLFVSEEEFESWLTPADGGGGKARNAPLAASKALQGKERTAAAGSRLSPALWS
jgi:hypothetical protein